MAPALAFTVRRREPVLVAPSSPTPYEFKPLSDVDDQQGLRFQVASVFFFRQSPSPSMCGGGQRDPVQVIKEALAKALVFYYPFAGRLRELGPNGKLVVECNAEGVMFVEADADVRLDQFGDMSRKPIPCVQELIADVEGSGEIVGCPLLLIQVTRLLCGGFIFAKRLSHPMADGQGFVRFMQAMAEMARGLDEPSVRPVWARELLSARDPPRITHIHLEYGHQHDMTTVPLATNLESGEEEEEEEEEEPLAHRSFFLGPKEISTLKARLPPHLRSRCSRLEVLMAFVWRSRSLALYSSTPGELVRLICVVNGRSSKGGATPLPEGYYGNVLAFPMAESTAGRLGSKGLAYAVELVRRAKARVTDGYLQSVADLMVLRGRPRLVEERAFMVSDLTKAGSGQVDFGWGEPVFNAAAHGAVMCLSFGASFFSGHTNDKGEDGIVVPMCLPRKAMERFAMEIESIMTTDHPTMEEDEEETNTSSLILSSNL